MTKSLVTGGAGFIGSHLVQALVEGGDAVRVLDNFSTGKEENLAGVLEEIELIPGDLRDESVLTKATAGMDFIYHQAAFVSVPASLQDPDTCFECNVTGTSKLLSAARKAGVRRVVLASSAAVYGDNPDLPLSEDAVPAPLSPYASSKLMSETLGQLYSTSLGLQVTSLRYFNVYGPRQNPASDYAAVIPIFIKSLLDGGDPLVYGDGKQTRDFIYVGDVVRANLLAAESRSSGQVFNICSGESVDMHQLLRLLSAIFSRQITPGYKPARLGDIYHSLGDPALAKHQLGFKPHTSLEEGLQDTVDWMKRV
jgi:nucleoside-diphosphate-sugar epimerase